MRGCGSTIAPGGAGCHAPLPRQGKTQMAGQRQRTAVLEAKQGDSSWIQGEATLGSSGRNDGGGSRRGQAVAAAVALAAGALLAGALSIGHTTNAAVLSASGLRRAAP